MKPTPRAFFTSISFLTAAFASFVTVASALVAPLVAQKAPPFALVVHVGVDDFKPGELSAANEALLRAGITRALRAGYAILKRGGTSVDAVEAALRTFESDTIFDAGRGSVVNRAGVAELDAAIMDGRTLKAGSVGAVHRIAHPISLARMIMDRTPHIMLVGDGAEAFALSQGVDMVPNSYLVTAGMRKEYEQWRKTHPVYPLRKQHGTTGAVALDVHGNLAAGTSTGGTNWKMPGRVGDSPIPGAGTYASNALGCAISSSGTGEYFIRNAVAADICHRAAYLHQSVDQAADFVINTELKAQDGDGGVIVLDKRGHLARVFNTNAFETGQIDPNGRVVIQFFHTPSAQH